MDKARLMGELQMLTGLVTNDYEYMLYKLLSTNAKVKDVIAENKYETSTSTALEAIEDLDTWFSGFMEVNDG